MRLTHACAALLVVALWGCDLGTEPEDRPPGARLPAADFSAWLVSPGDNPPAPDLDVRGESGRIIMQGTIGTAVPCYDIEAWASVRDRTVDLTIVADAKDVVCITVVATFGYEGVVRDLAPGSYDVRLSYARNGRREDVLQREVVVD